MREHYNGIVFFSHLLDNEIYWMDLPSLWDLVISSMCFDIGIFFEIYTPLSITNMCHRVTVHCITDTVDRILLSIFSRYIETTVWYVFDLRGYKSYNGFLIWLLDTDKNLYIFEWKKYYKTERNRIGDGYL